MQARLIYVTVLVIATCGLAYELVAGTLASYVLGDSVLQFSTVIGAYLSALGVGSWLSRFVGRGLARRFVEVELAVAMVGGLTAPILFLAFGHLPDLFRVVLYGLVFLVGVLVGLEIPLVLRLLKETVEFRELVAQVLTFDYLGALCGSLLFPMFFVPHLGLVRTSLLLGIANAAVGLWSTWLLPPLRTAVDLRIKAVVVIALLTVAFSQGDALTRLAESEMYVDEVVHAQSSPYQRIVLTRAGERFQLFLDGNLQFSSEDEYRYHEALVHPLIAAVPDARRVLVLGGGDGLAVRELLKYAGIEEVVLVELDPAMTALARDNPLLRRLNDEALRSGRVRLVHDDAFAWLAEPRGPFDAAVVDFPDPGTFSLGKLYTVHFYRRLRGALSPDAAVSVQSTSPLVARRSFWCIQRTLEAAGFHVIPYHAAVPSFGEWGYALASVQPRRIPRGPLPEVEGRLRFLDSGTLAALFVMGPDMAPVDAEINRLNDQVLVRYHAAEWARWN